jgi:hypothetical protein
MRPGIDGWGDDEDLSDVIEDYDPGVGFDPTVTENSGLRWEYQTRRDERLFDRMWLQDDGRRALFLAGWRHDLAVERARYKARLETRMNTRPGAYEIPSYQIALLWRRKGGK